MSVIRCDKCGLRVDLDLDAEELAEVELTDFGDDGAFRYEVWCTNCRARFLPPETPVRLWDEAS
jgi:hypothetical protein